MEGLLVCLLICYLYLVSSEVISRDVVLEQGTVRGYASDSKDVYSFYGIPYASAPRGEDRFKAPLDPPTWTHIFEATARNIVCPQGDLYNDPSHVLNKTMDCLIVNLFAPAVTDNTKLPVIVYIHGGGFRAGRGQEYNPVSLVKKGVLAVTLNYRLNAFGFLCLGTEFAPGNAGFKDQVAALKWVKKNIAQFGGDPNNILVAGSSAGAISVELQVLSPMSNGLFHKAALESGSTLSANSLNLDPLEMADTYAKTYGMVTGKDVKKLEEFYRSLTDEQLNEIWKSLGPDMGFVACVETHNLEGVEKFLKEAPSDIIKSGNYEKRPLLSGFTSMEGIALLVAFDVKKPIMEDNFSQFLDLVPIDISYQSKSDQLESAHKIKDFYFPSGEITYNGYIDFYTDILFTYPQVSSARLHAQNSAPVFLYMWSFNGTVNLPGMDASPVWGPGHIAESLYLFRFPDSKLYAKMTKDDIVLQNRIQEIYINFLKYGHPIPSQTHLLNSAWPPVTMEVPNYLVLDVDMRSEQYPFRERLEFWENLNSGSTEASRNCIVIATVLVAVLLSIIIFRPLRFIGFSTKHSNAGSDNDDDKAAD